jgi:trk system potassium uptake protein
MRMTILALGIAWLVPLAISLLYRNGSWASFLIPARVMGSAGGVGVPTTSRLRTEPWVLAALLGGVPFSLYYLLYTRRRLVAVLDRKFLVCVALIVSATLSVWAISLFEGDYGGSAPQALRDWAFAVTSVVTTTGFVTADFDLWDTEAKISLVVLIFVGGCAGSTAGGIKAIRILIVLRPVFEDVFRMVHPRAVTPLRVRDRVLPEGVRAAVLGLFAAWILVFVLATLLLGIQRDLDPFSVATADAATLKSLGQY